MYPSEVTTHVRTYVHVHVCTIASKFFNVHIEVVSILVFLAKMVISHIDFMLHIIETYQIYVLSPWANGGKIHIRTY